MKAAEWSRATVVTPNDERIASPIPSQSETPGLSG